jgi:hypothetical protein
MIREKQDCQVCLVCFKNENDADVLLCDGCDCAFHNYCCGMEHTIPEGLWFCPTCSSTESNIDMLLELHYQNKYDPLSLEKKLDLLRILLEEQFRRNEIFKAYVESIANPGAAVLPAELGDQGNILLSST